jgi:hypothetical protein
VEFYHLFIEGWELWLGFKIEGRGATWKQVAEGSTLDRRFLAWEKVLINRQQASIARIEEARVAEKMTLLSNLVTAPKSVAAAVDVVTKTNIQSGGPSTTISSKQAVNSTINNEVSKISAKAPSTIVNQQPAVTTAISNYIVPGINKLHTVSVASGPKTVRGAVRSLHTSDSQGGIKGTNHRHNNGFDALELRNRLTMSLQLLRRRNKESCVNARRDEDLMVKISGRTLCKSKLTDWTLLGQFLITFFLT